MVREGAGRRLSRKRKVSKKLERRKVWGITVFTHLLCQKALSTQGSGPTQEYFHHSCILPGTSQMHGQLLEVVCSVLWPENVQRSIDSTHTHAHTELRAMPITLQARHSELCGTWESSTP